MLFYNRLHKRNSLKKYIKIDGNNNEVFDYELYIKEVIDIDSNNNELQYELLLYYFLPPIFGIDLIIHTDNNTKTNKIIFKHSNNLNEKKDIIVIELLLKFGNVSILYSEDYYNKYENIIPLKNNNEFPLDKIRIIKMKKIKIVICVMKFQTSLFKSIINFNSYVKNV